MNIFLLLHIFAGTFSSVACMYSILGGTRIKVKSLLYLFAAAIISGVAMIATSEKSYELINICKSFAFYVFLNGAALFRLRNSLAVNSISSSK